MAKGSKSKTVSTQTPPAYVESAYKGTIERAADVANRPYQPYTGRVVAPLTEEQTGGIEQIAKAQNYAQPYIEQGIAGVGEAYGALQPQIQQALGETGAAVEAGAALNEAAADYYAGAIPSAQPYLESAEETAARGAQTGATMTGAAIQGLAGAQNYATPYNIAATEQAYGAYEGAQPYQGAATQYAGQAAEAVDPRQFSGEALQPYLSPYMQQVYQATLANINEQNAAQMNQLRGTAIARGAFGGDRAGIAAAEMARQQNLAAQNTLSGILQAGYGQAVSQFNKQQEVNLAADQANREAQRKAAEQMGNIGQQGFQQGIDLSGATQKIGAQGFGQGVTTAKTAADIGQTAFGQGQTQAAFEKGLGETQYEMGMGTGKAAQGLGESVFGQGLKGAGQRATIAQQGYETGAGAAKDIATLGTAGQTAALTGGKAAIEAGGVEQANQQALATAQYNQFLASQAYPFQTTQFLSDIVQGVGGQAGGTTTQSATTSQKGSTASAILGGLGSAADIYNTISKRGSASGGAIKGYADGGEIGMIPYQMLGLAGSYVPKRVRPGSSGKIFPSAAAAPELIEEPALDLGAISQSVMRAVDRQPLDLGGLRAAREEMLGAGAADVDRDVMTLLAQDEFNRRLSEDLASYGYDLGYGGRVEYADGGMPTGMIGIPLGNRSGRGKPGSIFPTVAKAPDVEPIDYGKMGENFGKVVGTIGDLSNSGLDVGKVQDSTSDMLSKEVNNSFRDALEKDFTNLPTDNSSSGLRLNFSDGGLAFPSALIAIPNSEPRSAGRIFPTIQPPQQQNGGGGTMGKVMDVAKLAMMFLNTGGRVPYALGGKTNEEAPETLAANIGKPQGLGKDLPDARINIPVSDPGGGGKIFPEIQQQQRSGGGGGIFGKILGGVMKVAKLGMEEGGRIGYEDGGFSDKDIMARIANQETRGEEDPYTATNPESTATGRYQFVRPTYEGLRVKFPDENLVPFSNLPNSPESQERAMRAILGDYRNTAKANDIVLTPDIAAAMHYHGEPEFLRRYKAGEPFGVLSPKDEKQPGLAPKPAISPEPVVEPGLAPMATAVQEEPGLGAAKPAETVDVEADTDRPGGIERLLGVNFSPEAEMGMRAAFASMLGGQNIGRGILTGLSAYTQAQQRNLAKQKQEAEIAARAKEVEATMMTAETGKTKAETEEAQRRFTQAQAILQGYKNLGNGTFLTPYGGIISAAEFAQLRDRLYAGPDQKSTIAPSSAIPVPPLVTPPQTPEAKPEELRSDPSVDKTYDPVWISSRLPEIEKQIDLMENAGLSTAALEGERDRLTANKESYKKGELVKLADGTMGVARKPIEAETEAVFNKVEIPKKLDASVNEARGANRTYVNAQQAARNIAAKEFPDAGVYNATMVKVADYLRPLTDNEYVGDLPTRKQILAKQTAELINNRTLRLAEGGVGRVLQTEVENLGKSIPQLENTKEANLYLLATLAASDRLAMRYNVDLQKYLKDNQPDQRDFSQWETNWIKSNPLADEINLTFNEFVVDPKDIKRVPSDKKEMVLGNIYAVKLPQYNYDILARWVDVPVRDAEGNVKMESQFVPLKSE